MTAVAFVNDRFVPAESATVSIYDRGYLFADSVYEVTAVLDGGLVDTDAHLARLARSLAALDIPLPRPIKEIERLQKELVARCNLANGTIYLQVTRGSAPRDFTFSADLKPGLVMFCQERDIVNLPSAKTGIKVKSAPDIRWQRRDIKSTGLLAQALAKQAAKTGGCQEALLVEDGFVTEGASSSFFILTEDGELITRPNSQHVLPGCTRQAVLALANEGEYRLAERRVTLEDAFAAREAFLTSASTFILSVVEIDGRVIGGGKPGAVAMELRRRYIEIARLRR